MRAASQRNYPSRRWDCVDCHSVRSQRFAGTNSQFWGFLKAWKEPSPFIWYNTQIPNLERVILLVGYIAHGILSKVGQKYYDFNTLSKRPSLSFQKIIKLTLLDQQN